MTVHQCPKCELRFGWKTELDDHCWHDHPEFRHEYPASVAPTRPPEPARREVSTPGPPTPTSVAWRLMGWLLPQHPGEPVQPGGPVRAQRVPSKPGKPETDDR